MPTPSRLAAAKALHSVFGAGNRVSSSWDADLAPEDAALSKALLGLCLRRWGCLQAYVKPKLKDASRGLPIGTQIGLALGLAQLAWLDGVASHAAVNEAVEITSDRALGFPPHKGLVNALLRRAASKREALRADLDGMPSSLDRSSFAEKVLRAAMTPLAPLAPNLVEADLDALGALDALWAKWQVPPRPAFRVLRGDVPMELAADEPIFACWRLKDDAPFPGAWLRSGAGMVQDRSSQALMNFQWEKKPARILDACAAPGGKTTALGVRFPGTRITAVERDPNRAERLRQNLSDRKVNAGIVISDAADYLAKTPDAFDLILLDAPCSGSGTMQKHPELPWIAGNIDLVRLCAMQRELLTVAIPKLAPGGLLIYAVCSWLPEEGEDHRKWMASAHPELDPEKIWPDGFGPEPGPTSHFRPHPLTWDGEGFQAFAWTKAR